MPIISKETWDNLIPEEEKEKIKLEFDFEVEDEYDRGYKNALKTLFGKEQLQPQPLTYEDMARELFKDGAFLPHAFSIDETDEETYPFNCISDNQCEKLLAINKLLNVARFLNGKDWKPDEAEIKREGGWFFKINNAGLQVAKFSGYYSLIYFRTEELAKEAIQILGEDTVRLALTSEY